MNKLLTISALGRRFGLSRSALLYYDRIGLLSPSSRSVAGYRCYNDQDAKRLEMIQTFRLAGVPLSGIQVLLDQRSSPSRSVLLSHLDILASQIAELQSQQRRVIALLGTEELNQTPRLMTRNALVSVFRSAGLDDDGMNRLHAHFERCDPQAHQRFLESLGLESEHIERVRKRARELPQAQCFKLTQGGKATKGTGPSLALA